MDKDKRIALHDFNSEADDELELKQGSIVEIVSIIDEDWFQCRFENKEGIVPRNIFSDLDLATSNVQTETSTSTRPSAPSSTPTTMSASSLIFMAAQSNPQSTSQAAEGNSFANGEEEKASGETKSPIIKTATASSLISTSLVTTSSSSSSSHSPTNDTTSSLAQGEKYAAEIVARIASNERVQQAAGLAKTGIVVATEKVRTVSMQLQESYKVGRDKASSVTGRGSRSDTAESKEAAVNYVADILESDSTKSAMKAGAHVIAALAGSRVGMSPSMSSLAASSMIDASVDIVQDSSVAVAKASVGALHSVVPNAVGMAAGVSYAMADTALRETQSAIHTAGALAARVVVAASSSDNNNVSQNDAGGKREQDEEESTIVVEDGDGPEIEVVESSSSDESDDGEVSDAEGFEDAQ